jgi:hypothetical protein
METTIGVRGTLILLAIYAAIGFPEIKQCLDKGGEFGSCAITGVLLGGMKAAFYLLWAMLSGLLHLAFK